MGKHTKRDAKLEWKTVYKKLDVSAIFRWCDMTEPQLWKRLKSERSKGYIYVDRGSNILSVAHMDVVSDNAPPPTLVKLRGDHLIYSERLDDRLGCYVITNLLPKLDIRCDILLTTNEECGCSTAEEFTLTSSKEYNWVVGFDRAGEDAVLYSYSRQSKWKKAVGKHFTVRRGTYSDISSMTSLGVCGVNVGIGYHNQHTEYCYASLMELSRQIERFRKFYREFKEEKFPYESYDEFELYDHDWRKYSWR